MNPSSQKPSHPLPSLKSDGNKHVNIKSHIKPHRSKPIQSQNNALPAIGSSSLKSTISKKKIPKSNYGSYGNTKVRNGYRSTYNYDGYGLSKASGMTIKSYGKKKTTSSSKIYGGAYGKYKYK